jgi:hypothetical protein
MPDWTHRLTNNGAIIHYLWAERSRYPLLCYAVSRKDTEPVMTDLCLDYVCFVV